ncbi:MAG: 23S rRNA (guanosine(2251)-2'-O)-methyltransferase RlmB [Vicinamibacterales bacterium]|nr:23S rRNA (guanosine(2251)-2'-O)-methyltransferase RlmB [Vicinamibacterales bacterium]
MARRVTKSRYRPLPAEAAYYVSGMLIYGINAVAEALRAGRVLSLRAGKRSDRRLQELLAEADLLRVPIRRVADQELDRESGGSSHQGVIAEVKASDAYELDDLIREAPSPALLVVLDGIEDPHNFGAILRSVDAAGAHGVVRQTRHSAPLGGATSKASAGALAHVKIADVVNIARAVEELKDAGIWTVGLAGDASQSYDRVDFTVPTALVVGAEGTGLRRLVRERCDLLASIPMKGHVDSLNVSVAAGIVLFEALRQRTRV